MLQCLRPLGESALNAKWKLWFAKIATTVTSRAQAYANAGRYDESTQDARHALKIDPANSVMQELLE